MELQTAELTLDDMDNVNGGCGACGAALLIAAEVAAAQRAADMAAIQAGLNQVLRTCGEAMKAAC
jgi:hypothetical protein